jgi:non-specific serine/threonine protein kinase
LLLWAEDSAAPPPPRRAGRRPRQAPHPYAAGQDELAAALGPTAAKAAAATTALHLPTAAGVPVGSPELVRDQPAPARLTLARWLVPTLAYEADDALPVLAALTDPDLTGAALALGATTRQLAALAAFAVDLVARGRLLPTIDPGPPRALWRPVLTGPDAGWAQDLALALPPAGRAAGDEPAGQVVAAALDALVDAVARAALGPGRLVAPRHDHPAGAWLRALTGRQRRFTASPARVRTLTAELADWQQDARGAAVRACFRLAEPDGDAGDWAVKFGLQATDEPSLLVDAGPVWRGRAGALTRHAASPPEALLAELGRASRLYPGLEPALRTARPTELRLDSGGAHQFLTAGAPLLAAAGFGVLLPSWWTRPRTRLGARVRATPQPGQVAGTTGLGREALLAFEWRLALGEEELTDDELAELTHLTTPLVRLRGQWVTVDPARLAAGVTLLGSAGTAPGTVAELLRLAAGEDDGPAGLPVTAVDAQGWLGDLLSGATEHRLSPAREPDGFAGTLRPYQRRGLAWLEFLQRAGLGGILADDMGLGKTAQTLALIAGDRDAAPTLLICPMSLVGNWQREAATFTPGLRVHVHHGAERARGAAFARAVSGADLVVTTYALAARDAEALREIAWRRVVVDEAQAIKNAATRQAAAVRAVPARHRVALTGTPVENRLADLWSIMEFVNPGLLGPAAAFRKRYAEPVERHGDEAAAARLRRLTGPFILRRLKTDRQVISDLPDKLEMEVVCNLTREQATLYQSVVADMLTRIEDSEGIERRGLVLATMTRLKQVCNHPAQFLRDGGRLAGRSGKLARLEEILEEVLAAGERALLFTQYAEFGAMLRGYLSGRFGREVAYLHGGVSKSGRDAMVARFQAGAADSPPLFVLSLKAGGTGLNLTAANHVVHVDRWWNPAVEDQATDRAFRIGQRRSVQVRKFVCAGTVEEKVAAMIRDKRELAGRIVGTGEQWLTELSTSQLRDLFRLEEGASVE